ncbi:cardiolipin synthase [Bacillus spongiae]|uniref:Cardiolipin synthase n=1 Tax=Bacillus spongiae TaxID=2683610 RepID=A0ABU8HIY6_9BACI
MWWVLILFILLILGIWIIVDFSLGKYFYEKNKKKRTYSKRKSNIQFFASGPELFKQMLADFEQANKSIHTLFFIVENDSFSQEFFNLLEKKASEGVTVRLMMDRLGSYKIKRNIIDRLKSKGVQVQFSLTPKLPFLLFSIQKRNHRKITVIDGEISYIGGFNVGKEYIDEGKEKLCPWRDYHLRITGEGTKDLQTEFLIDWGNTALFQDSSLFPPLNKGASTHQLFPSEGVNIEIFYKNLIENAQHTLIIGSPYFIPSKVLEEALYSALNRGVKLSILVPYEPDHPLVKEASFRFFRKLLPLGAQVHQYKNGFFHGKVIIVDHIIADLGTVNFDKRSFFINLEMMNLVFDPTVISTVMKTVEIDMKKSHLLTLDELKHVGLWIRFKEQIAHIMSDLL